MRFATGPLAVALLSLGSAAEARLAKVGSSTVVFAAKATGGVSIVGTTPELELREDGKLVVVSVPLAKLTTGIALRDRHLREKYLEVARYPAAVLRVERATLRAPGSGSLAAAGRGQMTIHGRTRPVLFQYTARRAGATIHVTASARIDIRDFGIPVPSFLGVTVKPEVDLTVTFAAEDR